MRFSSRCVLLLIAVAWSVSVAVAGQNTPVPNKATRDIIAEEPVGVAFAGQSSLASGKATKHVVVDEPAGVAASSDCLPCSPAASCRTETSCSNELACLTVQPCDRWWTVDYQVKTFMDSNTRYQFGTPETSTNPYSPLSKLVWPLDSAWHGLQVGVERPKWRAHFQWLTPVTSNVGRDMADYDWSGPDRDPASLSQSPERWNDGQNIELEGSYKLTDCFLSRPIELWPLIGFRFQRFDITGYDGVQVINDGTFPNLPPVGYRWDGDTITFNQQYYMGYIGAQLRGHINIMKVRPVTWSLQADWAGTWGYNVDHHISGYEDRGIQRYTMESTQGGAFHVAFNIESPLGKRFSTGIQVDHTEIRTWGSHHFVMTGASTADETWSNGVQASSDQTSIMGYVRARF